MRRRSLEQEGLHRFNGWDVPGQLPLLHQLSSTITIVLESLPVFRYQQLPLFPRKVSTMKNHTFFALLLCGIVAGVGASAAVVSAAGSAQKKICGDANGANNGTCPACVGNCDFDESTGTLQKYKICSGTGTTCQDTVSSQCSGVLKTGGTDGQGCDGSVVMDSTGVYPITCQNSTFKTCTAN